MFIILFSDSSKISPVRENLDTSISNLSQIKFDQLSSYLTNPFAKNCSADVNKSLEHINNLNESFNNKLKAAYTTIKKGSAKRSNYDTDHDKYDVNDTLSDLDINKQIYK